MEIVRTDSVGHAKRYIEQLDTLPDALLVAGGDGTVSEVVTGLLRRSDGLQCPLGILPVGKSNDTAKSYFQLSQKPNKVQQADELAKTALTILKGNTQKMNLLKIQPIVEEGEQKRPIFALRQFHWGAFRDVKSLQDKYWYYGPFRQYAAVFFNCLSRNLTWDCQADLEVTPACSGCRNCFLEKKEINPEALGKGRWWGRYVNKSSHVNDKPLVDYSKIINSDCVTSTSTSVKSSEVLITSSESSSEIPAALHLETVPAVEPGVDFIKESWRRILKKEKDESLPASVVEGRTITLFPQSEEKYIDKYFFIDNEEYEVRPVKISLIPNAFDVFTP